MSKMRQMFEQSIGNPLRCKIMENGNYHDCTVQQQWVGFQAAFGVIKEGASVWDERFCARMYELPEDL